MKAHATTVALAVWLATIAAARAQAPQPAETSSGCMACHQGIEPIRQPGSKMMMRILAIGRSQGDSNGCVVCHGGDPAAEEKEAAHQGPDFYPDPGSPWINENTCGDCHSDHVRAQRHSLMMTEAGKIQGVAWAFGSIQCEYDKDAAPTGYHHLWGNYAASNPAIKSLRLGTDAYRQYMERLTGLEPQVFVSEHAALPEAPKPADLEKLAARPELAAFTYLRNQCLRCHLGVKGRRVRGDYRGMGCSACHIPYGNEGHYQGEDKSIPPDETGHPLVHSIQATREAKVGTAGDAQYSGIPVETCTVCHNRGKRIGVSFQGLMEMPYTSPFAPDGGPQPALHTKHYIAMHQDLHYQKGMTCQDCHTSIDVHGDGFLAAANLAAVQIECSDCHGTPQAFPWELPLGFMDEFGELPTAGPPRGTAVQLTDHVKQGTVYPPKDGYLLTARGNPYSNVVRDGDRVIVHTAAGKEIRLKPLRQIRLDEEFRSLEGLVAMNEVVSHLGKMECYACHAAWAPQCYGCHVKIDYSDGKTCFDWLAAGHRHAENPESTADRGEEGYDTIIAGEVEEQRSFTRWQEPALGVNGEARITPVAPGCQVSITVIGPDGKPIRLNHIYRTPAETEGSADGVLSLDVSPLQPHTSTGKPRSCQSCHLSEKAQGYGIGGGRLTRPPDKRVLVDLETADGQIIPRDAKTQFAPIDGLTADWSRFVTEQGKQLQTVGHHFKRSRPLNDAERQHMDRQGVCMACHQEIPNRSLAVSFLHHVAEYTGTLPKTSEAHNSLLREKILLPAGWVQLLAAVCFPLAVVAGSLWYRRRRRNGQSS